MPSSWSAKAVAFASAPVFAALAMACTDLTFAHEYLPHPQPDEGERLLLAVASGASPSEPSLEASPPPGGPPSADEPAMLSAPGDGVAYEEPGRRSLTFRPDRVTALEGRVGYVDVFKPSVRPHKRLTALDQVRLDEDGTPYLSLSSRARRPIRVAAQAASRGRRRVRFWGSVVLELAGRAPLPLPVVSPESRILALRTEPSVALRLEKDHADNFYAVPSSAPSRGEGRVRLRYLLDAPEDYFVANRRLSTEPADRRRQRVPPLPSRLQEKALAFAAAIGIAPGDPFADTLQGLVAYFRGFEESAEPPNNSGDVYLDLARGRRGVCRHRAYAFVITAQSLGVYARFVQNEAHAWVEVERPGGGFVRVDLGGATGLDVRGDPNTASYRPVHEDPLPKPPAYRRALREASREQRGAGFAGRGEAEGAAADRAPSPGGSADGPAAGAEAPSDPAAAGGGAAAARASASAERAAGSSGRARRRPPPNERLPLRIRLDQSRFLVLRGQTLEVTGAVQDGSEGVAGLRVEVAMYPQAPTREPERLLGVTVTGQSGRFRAVVGVPPSMEVGAYRLAVRTPGNERFRPATAR